MNVLIFLLATTAWFAHAQNPEIGTWVLAYDPLNKLYCGAWEEGKSELGMSLPRVSNNSDVISHYRKIGVTCLEVSRRMSPMPVAAVKCTAGSSAHVQAFFTTEPICRYVLELVRTRIAQTREDELAAIQQVLDSPNTTVPPSILAAKAVNPLKNSAKAQNETCFGIRSDGSKVNYPISDKANCLAESEKYEKGKGRDKTILELLWGDTQETQVAVWKNPAVSEKPAGATKHNNGCGKVDVRVMTEARAVPRILPDTNGRISGFRLISIKPGSYYETIGLKNGDVLLEIDGKPINSPVAAMDFHDFSKTKSKQIKIERTKKIQTLNVRCP